MQAPNDRQAPDNRQAPNYIQQPDEWLLDAVARGDENAFATLYDRHSQVIYSMIARIVRDDGAAEDVLQESFWQVWKKASSYRGNGPVAAWLYRIARNRSLDRMRYLQRRGGVWQPLLQEESFDSSRSSANGNTLLRSGASNLALSAEQQITQQYTREHILSALSSMPVEQRNCLELAYFEGMSQRQIAEHTATPLGTVKARIRLGLQKLAMSLRALGYGREDG